MVGAPNPPVVELIQSDAYPSLIAKSLVLSCEWCCEGKTVYSSALCTPDDLGSIQFWNDQETSMVKWFTAHKRKHGEIACIRT